MNCKHLKIKTKKGNKYLYCSLLNKIITFDDCMCCYNKEYKYTQSLCKSRKKAEKMHNKVSNTMQKSAKLYKSSAKSVYKSIKGKKHKLTKATDITQKTKKIVWERDKHKCIFCDTEVPISCANSHFIKRSQLGLGIPENIVCACPICHDKYDFGVDVDWMITRAREHLKSKYEVWNEDMLKYKKTRAIKP